jgi:hypothetical protein
MARIAEGQRRQATVSPLHEPVASPSVSDMLVPTGSQVDRCGRELKKCIRLCSSLLAVLAAVVGCGSATKEVEPDGVSASFGDCVDLTPKVEEWLELQTNGSVSGGEAVRSKKHDSIYFISAHFTMDDVNNVGTWAMSSLESGSKTWAIDANAQKASSFDHGDKADEPLSMQDDAARASRACVPG